MILSLAGYKPCAKRWNLDTKDIYLLSSFWEHKSGHYGGYVCQEKHILDSGAFSAFSGKNNSFDWDGYVKKYADFVLKNNIQRFFELDIDVVVGLEKVEYYRKYLEDRTGRLFLFGMQAGGRIILFGCVKIIPMLRSVRPLRWKRVGG